MANSGSIVFRTGNWYAALSVDDGNAFSLVDPFATFPADDAGFCCDQIAIYDPSRDLIPWLLQHQQNAIRNRLRLAVAKGLDTVQSGTASWSYCDFTPDGTFGLTGQFFDFPNMSLGANRSAHRGRTRTTGATI